MARIFFYKPFIFVNIVRTLYSSMEETECGLSTAGEPFNLGRSSLPHMHREKTGCWQTVFSEESVQLEILVRSEGPSFNPLLPAVQRSLTNGERFLHVWSFMTGLHSQACGTRAIAFFNPSTPQAEAGGSL